MTATMTTPAFTCRGCGKDAGPSYTSHPMTDLPGTDGVNWGDVAMVLCDDCERATHTLKAAVDFINWRNRTHPRPVATPAPKHTPGPWYSIGTDGEPGVGITGYGVLATLADGDDDGTLIVDGLRKADADLIAAAPDMRAALAFCRSVIAANGPVELSEKLALAKADAALTKADGN